MGQRSWSQLKQQVANAAHSLALDAVGNPNGSYVFDGGDATPVNAIKSRALLNVDDFSDVTEAQTTITLLSVQVNAKRLATVTIGNNSYTLYRLLDDDGYRTRWAVK